MRHNLLKWNREYINGEKNIHLLLHTPTILLRSVDRIQVWNAYVTDYRGCHSLSFRSVALVFVVCDDLGGRGDDVFLGDDERARVKIFLSTHPITIRVQHVFIMRQLVRYR